ncbi:hypothetical protein HPB50_009606 [Hyalomma asiaticum]|uniref:Uncharacterized protein n=1 Tax=Hyalomma asiaticum TaxID=266040 RepID=A0ACB7TJY2_HYAAI|nr:hypothetical protein HPB50_009606 [Hyalomma asiaticum]
MVSLTVNMEYLNWMRWVVAPHKYRANRCIGECGFFSMMVANTTNHATVLALASDAYSRPLDYQVCCVPVSYESQSLLYLDNYGQWTFKIIPDMRVTACGCR